MIIEPSPFRALWVTVGKLQERLELEASPETLQLTQQLIFDIEKAENEWRLLNHGAGAN